MDAGCCKDGSLPCWCGAFGEGFEVGIIRTDLSVSRFMDTSKNQYVNNTDCYDLTKVNLIDNHRHILVSGLF